jgi:hypothetical protein
MNHRPDPRICPPWLLTAFLLAGVSPSQNGAFTDPSGRPIGGHEGYGDWVIAANATTVVATKVELLNALANATPGTVVYVRDDAVIDMGSAWRTRIGPYVTLASGRGREGSLGAMLFTTRQVKAPLFVVEGSGARITGLRLMGPDTEKEPARCDEQDPMGISVEADTSAIWSVRIDNNELWGWPEAGVSTKNIYGTQVQYNHIHHNRRKVDGSSSCRRYNLGYGVVVSDTGFTLIEGNMFDHNCHDIACDGKPNTNYEARFNLTVDGTHGHKFDVHEGKDLNGNLTGIAGTSFFVHHNTFLSEDDPAFKIRGRPLQYALLSSNEFRHADEDDAAVQVIASGNFSLDGNYVGVDYTPGWFVSFSGESFWRLRRLRSPQFRERELLLGDFDGDHRCDAIALVDNRLVWSRGASEAWSVLSMPPPPVPLSDVRVGDFDGNGRCDLFYTDRTNWYVARMGTRTVAWQVWNQSTLPIHRLGFGDFDGDGRTDVFKGNGTDWHMSRSGQDAWTWLNSSSLEAPDLRFHDFDGDGRADVFHTNRREWTVSLSGTSAWQPWNTSSVALGDLAFGDFDGDRRTDVFHCNGVTWSMSAGGRGEWQTLQKNSFDVDRLRFGDFNGDGRTDVLSKRSF